MHASIISILKCKYEYFINHSLMNARNGNLIEIELSGFAC